MKLAWATDIHLNFLHGEAQQAFFEKIKRTGADAVVLTGDISEAAPVTRNLKDMYAAIRIPVYFVFGNHDFYGSSVNEVRKRAKEMCQAQPTLHYLREEVVELTPSTALVGVDGWADAKFGDPKGQRIVLADWQWIADYKKVQANYDVFNRMQLAEQYGYIEANVLRHTLENAVKKYTRIIVATHVPPFWEATWHEGKHSDPDWVPWFSCKQVGDELSSFAKKYPQIEFIVLCGHTHGEGLYQHAPNMLVRTGGAKYNHPKINHVLEVG